MTKQNQYVSVYWNGEIFYIASMNDGGLYVLNIDAEPYYHTNDVNDDELGNSIFKAINASRQIDPMKAVELLESGGADTCIESRDNHMMQKFGYKNKRQLYRKMASCGVELESKQITISPTHHDRLESWTGVQDAENVVISATVSNAELGAAVREGFSRCRGAVPS
jgi:hypothetical protein